MGAKCGFVAIWMLRTVLRGDIKSHEDLENAMEAMLKKMKVKPSDRPDPKHGMALFSIVVARARLLFPQQHHLVVADRKKRTAKDVPGTEWDLVSKPLG